MLMRYSGYRIQSDAVDSNAALEADVMRFMAILGFCLLVVFALVQTMPMEKSDKIQIESEQILQARLQQLSSELETLQQQNSVLSQQHQQLTGVLVEQSLVKEKQRAVLYQKLLRQKDKLQQLQGLLTDDRTELSRVRRQLEMSESSVVVLTREFSQLNQDQKNVQAESAMPAADSSDVALPVESDVAQQPRVGFSLHFTDQNAFETLVDRQTISVFYFSEQKSWRVLGSRRFTEQILPKIYYQMASETIPETLQVSAKNYSLDAKWAVQLDRNMVDQIQAIMGLNEGGDLEITASGKVEFTL